VLSTRFEKPNTDEQGFSMDGPESPGFVVVEGVIDSGPGIPEVMIYDLCFSLMFVLCWIL